MWIPNKSRLRDANVEPEPEPELEAEPECDICA